LPSTSRDHGRFGHNFVFQRAVSRPLAGYYPFSPDPAAFDEGSGSSAPWVDELVRRRAFKFGVAGFGGAGVSKTESWGLLWDAMWLADYRLNTPVDLMPDELMSSDLWETEKYN